MPYGLPVNKLKQIPSFGAQSSPTTTGDERSSVLAGLKAAEPSGMISGRLKQEDLLDEMKRNLYLESQSGGRMVSGATPVDVESLQSKLSESPNFGTAAQANVTRNLEAGRQAALGGFGSPQEAAGYGRQMEAEKMRMPLQVAQATGAAGLERQREASRGALEVEKTRQDTRDAQYEAFQRLLSGAQGPKSISMSGVGGATFGSNAEVNPAMYARLDAARKAYENSKTFGFGGDPGLKAEVDKLMQLTGLAAPPAAGAGDDEIQKFALDIMDDPTAANLPWEQLQGMLPPELTPQQREALRVALAAHRGGM